MEINKTYSLICFFKSFSKWRHLQHEGASVYQYYQHADKDTLFLLKSDRQLSDTPD